MKTIDSLKPNNEVTVTVFGPDGGMLYKLTKDGYHSIEEAIQEVSGEAPMDVNPEDCVYEVANNTTDVKHRYRINAHGNLKLIV